MMRILLASEESFNKSCETALLKSISTDDLYNRYDSRGFVLDKKVPFFYDSHTPDCIGVRYKKGKDTIIDLYKKGKLGKWFLFKHTEI